MLACLSYHAAKTGLWYTLEAERFNLYEKPATPEKAKGEVASGLEAHEDGICFCVSQESPLTDSWTAKFSGEAENTQGCLSPFVYQDCVTAEE